MYFLEQTTAVLLYVQFSGRYKIAGANEAIKRLFWTRLEFLCEVRRAQHNFH